MPLPLNFKTRIIDLIEKKDFNTELFEYEEQ